MWVESGEGWFPKRKLEVVLPEDEGKEAGRAEMTAPKVELWETMRFRKLKAKTVLRY